MMYGFQCANGRIEMSWQPVYFIIMVSSVYFSMTVAELRFPVGLCILVSQCHPCHDNSRIKMSCQPVYFGIKVSSMYFSVTVAGLRCPVTVSACVFHYYGVIRVFQCDNGRIKMSWQPVSLCISLSQCHPCILA